MRSVGGAMRLAFLWAALVLGMGGGVHAEEAWQERFEEFCSRTGDVMAFSREELQALLTECESFRQQIETLPESPRKVQRKRLALSCNLVRFALEQKTPPPEK